MMEALGPVRCAMCFRSILSSQNGLNRHMEQNIIVLPKNVFYVFSYLFGPIESSFLAANFGVLLLFAGPIQTREE